MNIQIIKYSLSVVVGVGVVLAAVQVGRVWYYGHTDAAALLSGGVQEVAPVRLSAPTPPVILPAQVVLAVPYVNEAPDGNWTGPWKNGCEEAAVVMVEVYYQGRQEVSVTEAKELMQQLFDEQDREWGSNANSDAARTVQFIHELDLFNARIVEDPTVQQIKEEVAAGRPVITLHRGFELRNPNIPFLATGSSYHTLVVIGYDDARGEFIVHDDGDAKTGEGRRYAYGVVVGSLHDYNYQTKLADGPPRVIFTAQ
ncbi:MAG: C39 family peptidase [Candidatus Doudnabacteria bacterium]|nr:C39 family peptidase [Candidatus Doudnabacteria bacterium]